MATKNELEFKSGLLSTGLVQPIDSKSTSKSMEVLCRQVPGQDKIWLSVIKELLTVAETNPDVELHVCRRYVLREGKMAFGWHLGIAAKNAKVLSEFLKQTGEVLAKAKPSLVPEEEAEEQLLPPARQPATQAPPRRQIPLAPGQHPQRTAQSRPAGIEANVTPSPTVPRLAVAERKIDQDTGRETVTYEMPLPHVNGPLNVPNAKGRGARSLTGS